MNKMRTEQERSCKECESTFIVKRDWQIFCSDKCKNRYNARSRETCFYCGCYGNHRDHVDPRAFSQRKNWRGTEYVFACGECNNILSDTLFSSFEERIRFLIDAYRAKYKLDIPKVLWDKDEVLELGPALRRRIKRLLAKDRVAEEKVIYLGAVLTETMKQNKKTEAY